jgi:hypothetical protein
VRINIFNVITDALDPFNDGKAIRLGICIFCIFQSNERAKVIGGECGDRIIHWPRGADEMARHEGCKFEVGGGAVSDIEAGVRNAWRDRRYCRVGDGSTGLSDS